MLTTKDVSPTLEEYLEAIYKLERKNGAAKTSELAKMLNVALGTITNTIESMEKQNLIKHKPYKGVNLTRKGRRIAIDVIRRHRLSERLLTDILKIDWSKAHNIACKLEHAISDRDIIRRLDEVLGKPKTCPHGNPIPSEDGEILEEELEVLVDLNPGERGVITRIVYEDPELLEYLASIGLVPGVNIQVKEKAPFDGPITLKAMNRSYALGRNIASFILVKKRHVRGGR